MKDNTLVVVLLMVALFLPIIGLTGIAYHFHFQSGGDDASEWHETITSSHAALDHFMSIEFRTRHRDLATHGLATDVVWGYDDKDDGGVKEESGVARNQEKVHGSLSQKWSSLIHKSQPVLPHADTASSSSDNPAVVAHPRRLIFCASPAKSGNRLLAALLTTAEHLLSRFEVEPRMRDPYLDDLLQHSASFSFDKRKAIKAQFVAHMVNEDMGTLPHYIYAETSHMFLQTYYDVIFDTFRHPNYRITIVVPRHHVPQLVQSYIQHGWFFPDHLGRHRDYFWLEDAEHSPLHGILANRTTSTHIRGHPDPFRSVSASITRALDYIAHVELQLIHFRSVVESLEHVDIVEVTVEDLVESDSAMKFLQDPLSLRLQSNAPTKMKDILQNVSMDDVSTKFVKFYEKSKLAPSRVTEEYNVEVGEELKSRPPVSLDMIRFLIKRWVDEFERVGIPLPNIPNLGID
eukprot:TRINITY_DN17216_c0_g1_i1.p1 TRINITY_DN17216_c0_g1~~TRINITY_DN17216_c0_g1_i1.p1  ORF type:complete len:461 (+),score=69.78 TRINITY_DN17216_c0_g1_i1:206-1588(+)